MDKFKKIYFKARGHVMTDVVNFSLNVRPHVDEDIALEIASALTSTMTGEIIAIGWKPKKPFWESSRHFILPQHSMSMLRWQVVFVQKRTHPSYYRNNEPYEYDYRIALSIPFADPYFEREDTHWLGTSRWMRKAPRPVSVGWTKFEETLRDHIRIGYNYENMISEEPAKIEKVKFKASYVNTFVKNILVEPAW